MEGIFDRYKEEIEEIADAHNAKQAYEIFYERHHVGTWSGFVNYMRRQRITTYKKPAGETMTGAEKEDFRREWKEAVERIWRCAKKKSHCM